MAHHNPGYDIISRSITHNIERYIEVKSTSGDWEEALHIALTKEQFKEAKRRQEHYWLYVVENAESDTAAQIHCIQNPAQKIDKYIFDYHWKTEVEEIGGNL